MNNTFRLTNRFFIAIMIIMLPFQSLAAVKMIADIGQPAPDFPEGFIYRSIDPKPAIGASGHIAFLGVADVSLSSTENSTNVVWAGLPGQLRAIVRENEAVNGFPPNVLFYSAFDVQSAGGFVVTPTGAIQNACAVALFNLTIFPSGTSMQMAMHFFPLNTSNAVDIRIPCWEKRIL